MRAIPPLFSRGRCKRSGTREIVWLRGMFVAQRHPGCFRCENSHEQPGPFKVSIHAGKLTILRYE